MRGGLGEGKWGVRVEGERVREMGKKDKMGKGKRRG